MKPGLATQSTAAAKAAADRAGSAAFPFVPLFGGSMGGPQGPAGSRKRCPVRQPVEPPPHVWRHERWLMQPHRLEPTHGESHPLRAAIARTTPLRLPHCPPSALVTTSGQDLRASQPNRRRLRPRSCGLAARQPRRLWPSHAHLVPHRGLPVQHPHPGRLSRRVHRNHRQHHRWHPLRSTDHE
jgi:hypothetical protein